MSLRSILAPLALPLLAACGGNPDLVVYVSLDQVFSQELIKEFEQQTGLEVRAEYDTEANKTVGLVRRLIEEKASPRCDVFWNNEIAQTVRLAQLGMLMPYDSPSAEAIPETYRDPSRRWTGFAARARCLIVNTDLVAEDEMPSGMADLLDPRWHGKCGIARPLTGTTLTHAVALFDLLGEERAGAFWGAIAEGQHASPPPVNVVSSNGQLMKLVSTGRLHWGFTDTDDFNVARLDGLPVRRIFPDQEGEDPIGTLLIPNTVSILAGAPHKEAAKQFVDWVLGEAIEERMAFSRSAQIPVRPGVPRPDHVSSSFLPMQAGYVSIGMQMEARTRALTELFLTSE